MKGIFPTTGVVDYEIGILQGSPEAPSNPQHRRYLNKFG